MYIMSNQMEIKGVVFHFLFKYFTDFGYISPRSAHLSPARAFRKIILSVKYLNKNCNDFLPLRQC